MSGEKKHPLFVIDADSPVRWPVVVRIPSDGGEFAAFQFTGVFKRLREDEYAAILGDRVNPGDAELGAAIPKPRRAVLEDNAELFPQLMVGWEEVRDVSGAAVAFSEETLRKQITGINGVHLSIGLWTAIHEIRNGARLGN